ncbi:MAG: helix-turn-helix domain-containing protein [Peptostreptococcaceae bacterium]|nr:helix-turn-helix domain-containing protein [Peptostreptococcaceae bacterium]
MNVLEIIQELCKEKGTNPSKLEIELGFGRGTLYKWKKSSPNADKLLKIADYFGVSVDYLLGRTDIRSNVLEAQETIAAHHEGEWTEDELAEIERFKEFVKLKRQEENK